MYSLVIVHEDGAVCSVDGLSEQSAQVRFECATQTKSVVYAHWADDIYTRINHYVRERL